MNRMNQSAILLDMAGKLIERGSWCGETHVQKATYFLQALLRVPTDFTFVLYKHGPFSFDLRDTLTAMRADGLLDLQPKEPYGPSFVPTERGLELEKLYPKTLQMYENRIIFVADNLADKGAAELEKLATALFVTIQGRGRSVEDRAEEIHDLKPHVTVGAAMEAVEQTDRLIEASAAL